MFDISFSYKIGIDLIISPKNPTIGATAGHSRRDEHGAAPAGLCRPPRGGRSRPSGYGDASGGAHSRISDSKQFYTSVLEFLSQIVTRQATVDYMLLKIGYRENLGRNFVQQETLNVSKERTISIVFKLAIAVI
ncbi:hypothetical protein EVAR_11166_1 [Eumeta japonica]|uniref:Uncharacterized protein n=1 Tax=Eumeta variegata TaxID=151549 RepID=A0A4C1U419_EUMVA|nr:hypothetical protein EVAR_11166_1 [Eumeta japonica]